MNKKMKQTGCQILHLLCGPLDEGTVFEKRGEEADGAVDKKSLLPSILKKLCTTV